MMVVCNINGITVHFPYEPYDLQKVYMGKVIDCLRKEVHGVLESPTGTGKTLSLLCATLAYVESQKVMLQALQGKQIPENISSTMDFLRAVNPEDDALGMQRQCPQVIYSSRTHSQLTQAMRELKRTAYRYMKGTILASREQMCVHPDVKKESNNYLKTLNCQIKVKAKGCLYYNKVEREKDQNQEIIENPVIDIEDLIKLGETHKFCPYFMSKELKQGADIVFMPYNYLLDPRIRKALGIQLYNSIVILDEAHNVEKMCEESASFQLKSTDIALCIEEVSCALSALNNENSELMSFTDAPPDFSQLEVLNLKETFLNFEKTLDALDVSPTDGLTFEGGHIFELFSQANINDANKGALSNLLDRISTYLAAINTGPFQRRGVGLSLFADFLRVVFARSEDSFKQKLNKSYKVHINIEQDNKNQKPAVWGNARKPKSKILNYWCFSPGFGMSMLLKEGVKSVILTSGTLAPLKPLIAELEIEAPVQLENPHIVKGDQICVNILSYGPNGVELNSSYKNRDSTDYISSLGFTVSNLSKTIPDGLLIFFPSYPVMSKVQETWQSNGQWSAISQSKTIFTEPKDKNTFREAMVGYYECIDSGSKNGAIFMGVVRGKVSEGLDFANAYGRAVIITGLPYPPLKDPRVILKRQYLDSSKLEKKEFPSGQDWYTLEATKAVNQAIGRVIRHKDDYGAIILMDSRFNSQAITNKLSLWLRKHVKGATYGELIRELNKFYKEAKVKFPAIARSAENIENISAFNNLPSTSTSITSNDADIVQVGTYKRRMEADSFVVEKRKKIVIKAREEAPKISVADAAKDYLKMTEQQLTRAENTLLMAAIKDVRRDLDLNKFVKAAEGVFVKRKLWYLFQGLTVFLKEDLVKPYEDLIKKYL